MLKKLSWFYVVNLITLSINLNQAYAGKKSIFFPIEASLVIDSKTGKVLHDNNSKTSIVPASISKLMTLYILFESIESGKITMNQRMYISKKAEVVMPSKLGVKANSYITVKEAIPAIAIKSANDVSIVVAEHLKGSEEKFAQLMTIRAKQLGMKDTVFTNSSGIPDIIHNKSTARDLAKLAMAIKRDFPKYYPVLSENSFVYRGKVVKGHNRVNETYPWAAWGKTGFVNASGYNLITEATKDGKSLIAVVTGGKTWRSRDEKMVKLLNSHLGIKEAKVIMVAQTNCKEGQKTKLISKKTVSKKANSAQELAMILDQVNSKKVQKAKLVNIKDNKKVKVTKIAVNNTKLKNKKRGA
ncbi:MAG: D-alanyl-D-alanine carboxypeptidase [Rickettsia endosymbiont of Bryobia graminum]|nr:D-alanyl-D-alanine carboxypeptidase [Rickettsia endosymbiont of Bryobia graminum]